MGIKLHKLIEKKAIEISELEGKIIAVDAPNIIYGLLKFVYKNNQYDENNVMTDRTGRPFSHLYGLLFRVKFYYTKRIFPIFCFDGRDSELKRRITKDLLNDFLFTDKRYQDAIKRGDTGLAKRIALSKEYFWPNILRESKQLLGVMGVPYIESPAAAEAQCAQLVKDRIAHYSNSQDFDSLLFGCPNIVQNLSKSLRRKEKGRWTYQKIKPQVINLQKNMQKLNLDQFQLVDLAFLIGTDYFSGIKGIGPKNALELIKRHTTIEEIKYRQGSKYDFSKLTTNIINRVRKIFLMPEVLTIQENLYWNPPNKDAIFNLMCKEHNLNPNTVQNNLKKLVYNYNRCRKIFDYNRTHSKKIQKKLILDY
jgi:flap endonuclease-1